MTTNTTDDSANACLICETARPAEDWSLTGEEGKKQRKRAKERAEVYSLTNVVSPMIDDRLIDVFE